VSGQACASSRAPVDIDADSWRNKESQTFHKRIPAASKDNDKPKKAKA
jgi:hypothetical protein